MVTWFCGLYYVDLAFHIPSPLYFILPPLHLLCTVKNFKKYSEDFQESKINNIIIAYNEAVSKFNKCNSEIEDCKELLKKIQVNVTEYLKPSTKFKKGEEESAFCALLNIIKLYCSKIKEIMLIYFGEKIVSFGENQPLY